MSPIVQITNVHKYYGKLHVLKNVNLCVEENECVVIVGPSGSGKSTLLRCLNGLEIVQEGEIVVDGTRIGPTPSKRDLAKIRRTAGIVFQQYNLFPHLTVRRNITIGPEVVQKVPAQEARSIADGLLKRLDLLDKAESRPDDLSGGQRQRIAIARALAVKPKIILLDEITSALDPELIGEVLRLMEELAYEGMTMVVVSHEMSFARKAADRIVFMADGQVLEQGPPQVVLENPQHERTKAFVSQIAS